MISKQNLGYQVSIQHTCLVLSGLQERPGVEGTRQPCKCLIFVSVDLSTGPQVCCLLQSSHIPHNETDLSYNLVTVHVLRRLERARYKCTGPGY